MRGALIKGLTIDKDRREFLDDKVPASRPKYMWYLYKKHSQDFMKANLMFVLFLLPLFMCITVLPGVFQNLALSGKSFNFLGNIGFGFPGTVDSLAALKLAVYNEYIYLMLCIAGSIILLSVGASGLFYVCRNIAWKNNDKIKVFREFLKGIKLYFWKYLMAFVLIAAIFFGSSMLVLWHMSLLALGTANAGSWIAVVLMGIFDVYFLAVIMELLPMICAYKFGFFTALKNSAILALMIFPINIIVIALLAAPFLLGLISSVIMLFVWMFLIMFGGTFYFFLITSFGHYTFDLTINNLYAQGLKNTKNKKKKKPEAKQQFATQKNNNKKVKTTITESNTEKTDGVIVMDKSKSVKNGGMKITVINGDPEVAETEESPTEPKKEAVTKVVTKGQYGKYKTKKVK